MSKDLAVLDPAGGAVTLWREIVEGMEQHARQSRRPSTWRAYTLDFRTWERWAASHGVSALPASSTDVAAFISDTFRTHGRKLSTLKRYVASISVMHSLKGHPFEPSAVVIKTQLKGIAEDEKLKPRRKVRPFMAENVRSMLDTASPRLEDVRDAAVLALGVATTRRRSEIAGLDFATRGDGTGVLELLEDGAVFRLHEGKTVKRSGEPHEVFIQPGPALRAIKMWIECAGILPGQPVFRGITNKKPKATRISDQTIALIVKKRCAELGLDAKHYSGHSLRAGGITSMAEAGLAEHIMRLTTGHSDKSRELAGYIRPVEKKRHAVTNKIGL
jgi:integrase